MERMIFTLPNVLTIGRIAAIPIIVALFFVDGRIAPWVACVIFAAACLTDFLDGYLARAMASESRLGRLLDPIADKLLVGAVLLMVVGTGGMSTPTIIPAVVILCREILVSGLREHLAELNVSMPVTRLAKWKTVGQMVAIGFLIVGEAGPVFFAPYVTTVLIGEILLWSAAVLTLVTGWDYLKAALRHVVSDNDSVAAPRPRGAKSPPVAG